MQCGSVTLQQAIVCVCVCLCVRACVRISLPRRARPQSLPVLEWVVRTDFISWLFLRLSKYTAVFTSPQQRGALRMAALGRPFLQAGRHSSCPPCPQCPPCQVLPGYSGLVGSTVHDRAHEQLENRHVSRAGRSNQGGGLKRIDMQVELSTGIGQRPNNVEVAALGGQ